MVILALLFLANSIVLMQADAWECTGRAGSNAQEAFPLIADLLADKAAVPGQGGRAAHQGSFLPPEFQISLKNSLFVLRELSEMQRANLKCMKCHRLYQQPSETVQG